MSNSPLTCAMRALSHEDLAVAAAKMAHALEDIFHNRVDSAIESADRALRNTGVLAIQALVCDEAADALEWRECGEANRIAEGRWEDNGCRPVRDL